MESNFEHFELSYSPYMDGVCAYTCALYVSLLVSIVLNHCKSARLLQESNGFHHTMAGLNATCCVLFLAATCVQTYYYHLISG